MLLLSHIGVTKSIKNYVKCISASCAGAISVAFLSFAKEIFDGVDNT